MQYARQTIAYRLGLDDSPPAPPGDPVFSLELACFVTLEIGAKLRGCIGNLTPVGSLLNGVRDNALHAAFHDSRFSALSAAEFASVDLHLSILTRPEKLEYRDSDDLQRKLRPGIDGVILRDGRHGATFLPQVWDQLPDVAGFLGRLCIKAGLPEESWRHGHLEIETYQVQSFKEDSHERD